jgi:hypothetical protein
LRCRTRLEPADSKGCPAVSDRGVMARGFRGSSLQGRFDLWAPTSCGFQSESWLGTAGHKQGTPRPIAATASGLIISIFRPVGHQNAMCEINQAVACQFWRRKPRYAVLGDEIPVGGGGKHSLDRLKPDLYVAQRTRTRNPFSLLSAWTSTTTARSGLEGALVLCK